MWDTLTKYISFIFFSLAEKTFFFGKGILLSGYKKCFAVRIKRLLLSGYGVTGLLAKTNRLWNHANMLWNHAAFPQESGYRRHLFAHHALMSHPRQPLSPQLLFYKTIWSANSTSSSIVSVLSLHNIYRLWSEISYNICMAPAFTTCQRAIRSSTGDRLSLMSKKTHHFWLQTL